MYYNHSSRHPTIGWDFDVLFHLIWHDWGNPLNPKPCAPNPKTLNPKPQALNPKFLTLNPLGPLEMTVPRLAVDRPLCDAISAAAMAGLEGFASQNLILFWEVGMGRWTLNLCPRPLVLEAPTLNHYPISHIFIPYNRQCNL